MEVHNAIKYATADVNAHTLHAGLSRDASGIERLSESLQGGYDLYGPTRRYEFDIHRQVFDWAITVTQGAIAAELGFVGIGLNGPVGGSPASTSNLQVLVVEGASARTVATAQGCTLQHTTRGAVAGTGTLIGTALNRDQRWASGSPVAKQWPVLEGWQGSDPAVLNAVPLEEEFLTGTFEHVPFKSGPWIVKPGGALIVQASTVNLALVVNMWGLVRPALPGEFPNPLS